MVPFRGRPTQTAVVLSVSSRSVPRFHPATLCAQAGRRLHAILCVSRQRLGRASRLAACLALSLVLAACASTPASTPSGHYRVQSGDTLYSIARRFDQNVSDLVRWNKLPNANRIERGQLLRVQSPTGAASQGGKSTGSAKPAPRSTPKPKPTPRPSGGPVTGIALIWPAQGKLIGTYGGASSGLTISNSAGTPVVAAAAGTVAYAAAGLRGYGNMVIVRHGNGSFLTIYAHNRKLLVRQGQTVKQGQTIAEMGDTDRASPALYFELRRDGKAVNPTGVLPKR